MVLGLKTEHLDDEAPRLLGKKIWDVKLGSRSI
jgi:hypothetical protein